MAVDYPPVDLLYLARDRLEFTKESFSTLLRTTDWGLVRRLSVYDDGSRDGTDRWLAAALPGVPIVTRFVRTRFSSPVAAMGHWIETSEAPILAKTDNDAMLPPGWLRAGLAVLERHPELQLLGIEAMSPHVDDPDVPRSFTPAEFISGLGLYRREAFARSRPVAVNRWFGLEEWQMAQGPGLVRGWMTPALPVFLLDRLPFHPWRGLSDEYIRRGWQRPWQGYPLDCSLWHWRWPIEARSDIPVTSDLVPAAPQAGAPRFVGALRVKNEAAHIREAVERILPLCERVLVLDDHSTDATPDICRSFGDRVSLFPSPFQGLDEARDKNFLLGKIRQIGADWVLWIDGDEVLERSGADALRTAVARAPSAASFSLRIAFIWNSPHQVRIDGIFGQFRRPSLFRLLHQPVEYLQFRPTGRGGNLHCGNAPWGLIGRSQPLDVRLKHYGYMLPEQRSAKYAWYTRVDPNNAFEDNYRHLADIPGALYAPGPARLVPWTD
jgi:hypothetical protein